MAPSPQLPERKHLSHVTPPWVKEGEVFFVTICCAERRINQLAKPEIFGAMTAALEEYIRLGKLWAHLFLAMPDHLHALLSFPAAEQMAKVVRDWKRFVARQEGIAWQPGFFDHRLRSAAGYVEKAGYIRMNPVRAGFITDASKWQYIWEVRQT